MRAAFLFDEVYPNYDQVLKVLRVLKDDERALLNTLVFRGLWGLCTPALGPDQMDRRIQYVQRLLFNMEGGLTGGIKDYEGLKRLAGGDINAVVFNSIPKRLVHRGNERLQRDESYLGFMQVLADNPVHVKVFNGLIPTFEVRGKKIHVIYHVGSDKDFAKEILNHMQQDYSQLALDAKLKHVGWRFSVYDAQSENDFGLLKTIADLGEECESVCEETVYSLQQYVPEVIEELNSAIKVLRLDGPTAAQARNACGNLRHCLEIMANKLQPENVKLSENDLMDRYKAKLYDYVDKTFDENSTYTHFLRNEIANLTLMLNKGVHEDWVHKILRPVAIRMIILLGDLIHPRKTYPTRMVWDSSVEEMIEDRDE